MLNRSFLMLPGIGQRTERSIWAQGVNSWREFIGSESIAGISASRLEKLRETAAVIEKYVNNGDLRAIAEFLPHRERWRLFDDWQDNFAAIDIETAMIDNEPKPVIVSVCIGRGECVTLVRGDDLCWRSLGRLLDGVEVLVTFNGSSFDIPLLKKCGYRISVPLHVDILRYCGKAGLRGGLKRIESTLGIERDPKLALATHQQISYLWSAWKLNGAKRALDLLIGYNRRDTESVRSLALEIYSRLSANIKDGGVAKIGGTKR